MWKQVVSSYSIFINWLKRLRKRNWCYLIHCLHLIWTMQVLVNKYSNDHPQALRSNGTEEPKCTLWMLSLPISQWLHAHCPSGIWFVHAVFWAVLRNLAHTASALITDWKRRLIPEPGKAFWQSLIWCFWTRPKIVKKGVYCLKRSSLHSHLYHSLVMTNGQDLQFQPLTKLGTRKPFPHPGYRKLIFLELQWVEFCLETDT